LSFFRINGQMMRLCIEYLQSPAFLVPKFLLLYPSFAGTVARCFCPSISFDNFAYEEANGVPNSFYFLTLYFISSMNSSAVTLRSCLVLLLCQFTIVHTLFSYPPTALYSKVAAHIDTRNPGKEIVICFRQPFF
jgi:hypothetical protein